MDRVVALVDGFNLYHSIRDIQHITGATLKWLDIFSLCKSFSHLISPKAQIQEVYYFSAYATHIPDPDTVIRHKTYISCLENSGVITELGKFKPKEVLCPSCNHIFTRHEEKETDVRIATKICHLLVKDPCKTIVVVTGDTDLAPSIEHANTCFLEKRILFAFPFNRVNDELRKLAPGSFKINKKSYINHQFPDPYTLSSGVIVNKPSTW
jgi:uncharacterized LabA/DUF88 family protein